jgi:hypothetical protein
MRSAVFNSLVRLDVCVCVCVCRRVRYCKTLEESSFRGRTADFFYMILFGATVMTVTLSICVLHASVCLVLCSAVFRVRLFC